MNSKPPKPPERPPAADGEHHETVRAGSKVAGELRARMLGDEDEAQPEASGARGRNQRLLSTIADLLGVPESSFLPGAERLGSDPADLGELNELVHAFLAIEAPEERRRILEAAKQAASDAAR